MEYNHGVVTKMTLADGPAYSLSYDPADVVPARALMLEFPDGRVFRMWMTGQDGRIREQRACNGLDICHPLINSRATALVLQDAPPQMVGCWHSY
jgi:hypothetical protein